MSDSGPPPESKQLIATEDSVQAGQPTKWDFLEQQTVTLTLNLNDILKNENQPLLNNCEFSVSGRMAFTCQNCEKPPTDSTLQVCNAKDNDLTFQSFRRGQQACDSEIQKIVDAINNNTAILHASSDLLQKCAKRLEELISSFDAPPGNNDESGKVKQKVEREIKDTTSTVIRMLEESRGDTGTVDSNDDDDDKPASDDDDSDGLSKESGDPKGTDNPKGPTNLPDDSSKKDEGLTGNHHTDLAQEHNEHESTEFFDAVIGSQEKQAKLTESVSASEIDKQEIGEDQKQGKDDSEPQQIDGELVKSSEKAPNAEEDLRQGNESPKKSFALEDLLVPEPPNSQEQEERMESELVEPTLPEIDNAENSSQVLPLTASTQNQMEQEEQSEANTKDITAVGINVALSLIEENESGDVESILLSSEMDKQEILENLKQEEVNFDQQDVKHEVGGNSEEAPNAEANSQLKYKFPQESSEEISASQTSFTLPLATESGDGELVNEDVSHDNMAVTVEQDGLEGDATPVAQPDVPLPAAEDSVGESHAEEEDLDKDASVDEELDINLEHPVSPDVCPLPVYDAPRCEGAADGEEEEVVTPVPAEDVSPTQEGILALVQAGDVAPMQGDGVAPMQGGGVAPVQAKGETQVQAAGVAPMQGDDVTPVQAEGEATVQAGDATPVQAEGVTPVLAERVTPMQAEEEAPVQAGDMAPVQEEGEIPVQAGDATPVEAGRVTPMQAEEVASVQAEDVTPVEEEGVAPMQVEIVAPVQAEGETQVQAEGEAPVQAEDMAPVQEKGEAPVQAGDATSVQAEDMAPVQAGIVAPVQEGDVAPMQSDGVDSVQAGDVAPMQAEDVTPVQAEGKVPVQAGDGTPVQAENGTPVQAGRVTLSGNDVEVVPAARSSLQQEAELPQKPSTPTLSVIEEVSTESRSDNSRIDENVVSQPDVQLQKENDCGCHEGKTSQLALTSKQLKKKNKKEVQKDKNLKKKYGFDEKNAFGTSVEVMLSTFLAEMNDIQKKQTKPCDIKFSKTLKGISLFYKNDYCKQHTMDPQDVFKKLLGDKWEEKNDSESEICKQLICFFAQETFKTSAQTMIAYLHNEYNKVKNPKEKASFTKKLLAVFTEEIVPWVEGKWLQNVKDYAEYRMQELEGQSKVYAWKDEPAKYNENQRVRDRIEYYKKQLDTVENRLILDCYSFLIFQAERLIRYHRILDSDLDYMCRLPKATIKKTELKFFKAIYGLDDELIAKMLGETKRVIKREMQEPESYEETTFIEEERFHKHHLIHFLLSVNVTNLPFAPGKVQRNKYLNDFCKFRLSENIDKYRDATLEIVTLKLLGPKESWKDKNEKEHQLFRVLEELIVDNTKIRHCAEEMIAYIEHLYTLTSEDKECFAETFTDSLEADLQTWLACQLNDQLQKYVKHHEDCRKHFKVIEKYCWKPRPQSYKTSEFFDDREQYHWLRSNTKDINTFYSEYYLDNINVLKSFSGGEEILNEDFDYLSTRSRKEMRKEEYQFFFAIFPYDFS